MEVGVARVEFVPWPNSLVSGVEIVSEVTKVTAHLAFAGFADQCHQRPVPVPLSWSMVWGAKDNKVVKTATVGNSQPLNPLKIWSYEVAKKTSHIIPWAIDDFKTCRKMVPSILGRTKSFAARFRLRVRTYTWVLDTKNSQSFTHLNEKNWFSWDSWWNHIRPPIPSNSWHWGIPFLNQHSKRKKT